MKGMSSYVITLVIVLVVAAIGLVLFWLFIKNTTEGAKTFSENVIDSICNSIGIAKHLLGC